MERLGLAALLVVLLPSLAPAQRVEVALLMSRYQPTPGIQRYAEGIDCSDPCPPFIQRRVAWGAGALIGGRVGLQFDSRFGVDATIQRGHFTNEHSYAWGTESGSALDEVAATFVALQPRVRLRVADSVHATVGAGPLIAFSQRSTPQAPGPADTRMGVAFSAALRLQIRGPFDLELRASDYVYLEANAGRPRNGHDLTYGVGVALALNRRSE